MSERNDRIGDSRYFWEEQGEGHPQGNGGPGCLGGPVSLSVCQGSGSEASLGLEHTGFRDVQLKTSQEESLQLEILG